MRFTFARALCLFWAIVVAFAVFINLRSVSLLSPGDAIALHYVAKHLDAHPKAGTVPVPAGGSRVACSCEGSQEQRCCWVIQNSRLRATFEGEPFPQWHSFEDAAADRVATLPVGGSPLLLLKGKGQEAWLDCKLLNATQASQLSISFSLICGQEGMVAEFSAELPSQSAHYVRVRVKIWSRVAEAGKTHLSTLQLYKIDGWPLVAETRATGDDNEKRFGFEKSLEGLPILINNHFFVGVEHPMAVHLSSRGNKNATHWEDVVGQITHLGQLQIPTEAAPWVYGAVFGAYSETSQARRDFVTYIHNERPGRRTPMVHYNSWYDFYSYQDEGFNGGFNDRFHRDDELIAGLRLDKMNDEGCLRRVEEFGVELVQKRNTTIDSFLWDDGWDDPQTLWQFDKQRFPHRFDAVAAKATEFGAGTGVWLSPWGGYGFPQENRVKYGKAHGFETNQNERMDNVEAFSLAGPNYRKVFTETALNFVREEGVNMFKFDGVAGDPRELAVEMEAMLGLLTDLRHATGPRDETKEVESKGKSKVKGKGKDNRIWINLTTGTWASPFFLMWADSIWRGGSDIASHPKDWEPDPVKYSSGLRYRWVKPVSDGLTRRQRWIRWRSLIVYVLVVRQSTFFPLSQLMIHGVIVASHGDALHYGLDKFDEVDFAQEVWTFVAMGLQLQELYIAPRHMTPQAWDILAEGLQWARREASVLRDSHWAFGDPTYREVYCIASWDVVNERGFVFLHNPKGVKQDSQKFWLAEVLEFPEAQEQANLEWKIVKSIAHEQKTPLCRYPDGPCPASASAKQAMTLLPFEVKVLEVQMATTGRSLE